MEFHDTTTRQIALRLQATVTFFAGAGLCLLPFYVAAKHAGFLQ